jgi:DNA repair exonuclease SbcCD nuclease subunit
LDSKESVWTDPVRANPRAAIQEERKSAAAATKIQSVARMYNSNAAARATIQEDLPHPDLIKLSAVGASAFALGGYVNQSFFNQQREEEAQTAREGATIRIRQLEEQLAAAEAAKRLQTAVDLYSQPAAEAEGLQTAVDFYNHTTTLNNNTSCQLPDFFNQSCLLSAHPGWMKAAPMGMSAFLVGGYVAQKVRRSYNSLQGKLETSTQEKRAVEEQLTTAQNRLAETTAERQAVEEQLRTAEANVRQLEERIGTSTAARQAVEEQLTTAQNRLTETTTERQAVEGQLTTAQNRLAETTAERQAVEGQLRTAEANVRQLEEDLTAVGGLRTRTITNIEAPDENGRTPLILAVQQQNEPLVRMLLNKGANVATAMQNSGSNICADQSGYTVFYAAVDTTNLPIFHMLIEAVNAQEAQQALKDHHMRLLMTTGEILRCNIVRYIELAHLVATNPVLRAKLHMMATVLREELNIHGLV